MFGKEEYRNMNFKTDTLAPNLGLTSFHEIMSDHNCTMFTAKTTQEANKVIRLSFIRVVYPELLFPVAIPTHRCNHKEFLARSFRKPKRWK